MSESIGNALNDSVAMAVVGGMATLANWRCTRSMAALGAAFGYAFRTAELAYDLGQRHARERAVRFIERGVCDERAKQEEIYRERIRSEWRLKLIADGRCMANNDGECDWTECPQFKDHKPTCPRWATQPDDER